MKKIDNFENRPVSDEELKKVSGGNNFVPNRLCSCGAQMFYDGEKYICPDCGHIEY